MISRLAYSDIMNKKTLSDGSIFIFSDEVEAKLSGIIDELLAEAKNFKNWGIISPLILSKDNKILWHGGYIAPNLNMPMSYGAGEDYLGQYPGTRETTVVPFYCAIISKSCASELEVPDELGNNIFDDANYCMHVLANDFKILSTSKISVKYYGKDPTKEGLFDYQTKLREGANSFIKKWGSTFNKYYQLPVCYQGRVSAPTGFSVALGNYMKFLSFAGVDVNYSYIQGAPETEPQPEDMYLTAITEKVPDVNMPQIVWGQAPLFFKNSGKYKIGHCEFEGDEWPQSWVPYCNMMDELWVPSKIDRQRAIKAGVNKPIHIIEQGIDPDYYHPDIAPMRMEIPQTFKFICTAAWLPRKNLNNLIKTFARTFKKTDDVCLVIKTVNLGLVESIEDEIKKLDIPDDSGWVYVREDIWPNSHLASFYTSGHCFVLPTHGEGWGLPIFEALACGIPVITTGYGVANETLRDPEHKNKPLPGVHLLDYNLSRARTPYEYLKNAMWASPNLNQLAEKMKYVYNNYAKEKKAALKTSEYIRTRFAWSNVIKPAIERLKKIYDGDMDPKKINH